MPKRDRTQAAFGSNVRRIREKRRLTQEGLGEKAGLDQTYISDIERGLRNPGIKNVVRLAQALGVAPATLFDGIGS